MTVAKIQNAMQGTKNVHLDELEAGATLKVLSQTADGNKAIVVENEGKERAILLPAPFSNFGVPSGTLSEDGNVILENPRSSDGPYSSVVVGLIPDQKPPLEEGVPAWRRARNENVVYKQQVLLPSADAIAGMMKEENADAIFDGVLEVFPMSEAANAKQRIMHYIESDNDADATSPPEGFMSSVSALGTTGSDGLEYLLLIRILEPAE